MPPSCVFLKRVFAVLFVLLSASLPAAAQMLETRAKQAFMLDEGFLPASSSFCSASHSSWSSWLIVSYGGATKGPWTGDHQKRAENARSMPTRTRIVANGPNSRRRFTQER